ncbi:cupin domain-containing protein [Vibrio proteolyticus]|uniref:Cupin type-2 domain-containing protein n=1 Tax=Vibrio proteolyticus NBRC 13287 TaxID=1219065 RepID=U2ZGQ8_VIBPR|nr:cupin domain-containing protein [Vibrio proteolyticus]GAD66841.1 hypothetical protein VPR01S_05_01360 [Vibrio proteolyticus NBRC 13287]
MANYSAAYVTFQPGARSAWHSHPAGQHIIVTSGVALTGTRDGNVIRFSEGESVWCPPGVEHWHGATPEAAMTHLVVTPQKMARTRSGKRKSRTNSIWDRNKKEPHFAALSYFGVELRLKQFRSMEYQRW